MKQTKTRNLYDKQNNSNLQILIQKDSDTIIGQNNQFKEEKEKPFNCLPIKNNFLKINNFLDEKNKNINDSLQVKLKKFITKFRTSRNKSKKELNQLNDIENKISEKMMGRKNKLNWFKYFWFIICCKRKNSYFSFYQEYRAKFISEENIIQDSLNITRIFNILNFDYKQDVDQCSSI